MSRQCSTPSPRSRELPTRPVLVGCHRRRLDANHRLRLPAVWAPESKLMWLLCPQHLLLPNIEATRELSLFPTDAASMGVPSAFAHVAGAPTLEALLELLRDRAGRASLAPTVATAVQINPTQARFAISIAQLAWLGYHGRVIILAGVLTHARICTSPVWHKWKRAVARRLGASEIPKCPSA